MRIVRMSAGATLIELLVALMVVAILLSTAVGGFAAIASDVRHSMMANGFLADLAVARSEAIRSGRRVVVCKSTDAHACSAVGDWGQGRLVFEDANNNGARDSTERIIAVSSAAGQGWKVQGNGPVATYVSYHPMGRTLLLSGAFQAGTITLCKRSVQPTRVTSIVIGSSGRAATHQSLGGSCT